jgi:hypothetical protein
MPINRSEAGKDRRPAASRPALIALSSPNLPIIDSAPVANVRQHFWILRRAPYLQRLCSLGNRLRQHTMSEQNSRNFGAGFLLARPEPILKRVDFRCVPRFLTGLLTRFESDIRTPCNLMMTVSFQH